MVDKPKTSMVTKTTATTKSSTPWTSELRDTLLTTKCTGSWLVPYNQVSVSQPFSTPAIPALRSIYHTSTLPKVFSRSQTWPRKLVRACWVLYRRMHGKILAA